MMDFSAEDGLKWHEKKHKISLKLGLSDNNDETTDQTPTPTRFIRNCEEVGLFQDLQHVNPFDETFKQAIQSKSNGTPLLTLTAPTTCEDDTLHTPHIFPPLEEGCEKPRARKESIDDITLVINDNVIPICYDHGVEKTPTSTNSTNGNALDQSNIGDEHTIQGESISSKHKQLINCKTLDERQTAKENLPQNHDDCVIINPVNENQNNTCDIQNMISKNTEHFIKKRLAMQRLRECNRKAQARLRNRRKITQNHMEFNYKYLQAENAKLKAENLYLRDELIRLKGQIDEQSKSRDNVVNKITSEDSMVKKIGTTSLNLFTRETPIFNSSIPGTSIEESVLPKKSSTSQPRILPKPANTVYLHFPVLQAPTLPIILANNSQIALAVQNPSVQNPPRKILPLPNQVVENEPVQSKTQNVPTSIPSPKKSKKRKKKK